MKRRRFQRLFSRFFSAVIPTPFRGVETDKIINSEVIYEQANYNQTALIQITKCTHRKRICTIPGPDLLEQTEIDMRKGAVTLERNV